MQPAKFPRMKIPHPSARHPRRVHHAIERLEARIAPAFAAVFELAGINGANGFKIPGLVAGDTAAAVVSSAGDINGDGFADFLVGAPIHYNDNTRIGATYVIFGKAGAFTTPFDLSTINGTNGFKIVDEAAGDHGGSSVAAAGDINGDGFDDLLIGAPEASPNGVGSGAAYLVFGKASGFGAAFNLSALNGANGVKFQGEAAGHAAGKGVGGAGDVNGDGLADLIIGAPGASPHGFESGASYVVFGSTAGFAATFNLSTLNGTNGFKLQGEANQDHAGYSVSGAGDVNGDGFADVLIGSSAYDNAGAAYLLFGKSAPFTTPLDLSTLNGATGFKMLGEARQDGAGSAVSAAGDVNGDGFDDVIVGAPTAHRISAFTPAGASYVVFGKASGFTAALNLGALSGNDGFILQGEAGEQQYSGRSVAGAGDINGDGFDDVIVGMPDAADFRRGYSFVYFGKAGGFATVTLTMFRSPTLDGSDGFAIRGEASADESGTRVSVIGDINRDGFADLLIGAPSADPNGINSGAAYVIYGHSGLAPSPTLSVGDAAITEGQSGVKTLTFTVSLLGSSASAVSVKFSTNSGTATAGSDFNAVTNQVVNFAAGETSKTVIVGIRGDTTLEPDETFSVMLSSPTNAGIADGVGVGTILNDDAQPKFTFAGLTGANGFKLSGIADGDHSGQSVSDAGDVNGDGFSDLIIGAPRADEGGTDRGAAYVVFGKAGGFVAGLNLSKLNGSNGFKLSGIADGDKAGSVVSAAGDVNGDGFGDLIIGAARASGGGTYRGETYVVFGKARGFSAALTLSALNGANGFTLSGVADNDFSGGSVSGAGDVNGDGVDDLIIGASDASSGGNNRGASYVVFGKRTAFSAALALSSLGGSDGFVLTGAADGDGSGNAVSAAGDVNGDGIGDVIIGAFGAAEGGTSRGASYVVFGKSTAFTASIALSALAGTDGLKLSGETDSGFAGSSVSAAGDVNGDGIGDVIVGAIGAAEGGTNRGASYVVFGKATAFTASIALSALAGTDGFKLSGTADSESAGGSVSAAGDVNGDGFDDLIVGAAGAAEGGGARGASFVFFGKSSGFAPSLALSAIDGLNGFKLSGIANLDFSGGSVSAAGDVNGDGFADLIIGANGAAEGGTNRGASYVVFGTGARLDAKHPLTFTDASGDTVRVTLKGSGYVQKRFVGDALSNADLASLELFGSDLSTTLNVAIISKPTGQTTVAQIFTHGPLQHVGGIVLGPGVRLGDGLADALPDLQITGKLNKLVLDDVLANTFIQLGHDLPYNLPDKTTPDTYNHHPDVVIGDILGPGVRFEVLGDGTPFGVGGGGLGDVTIGSWAFPGLLATTQSIGDFTVLHGDFLAVLEIDKFHRGGGTIANAGNINVISGAFGSTGSVIEGNVRDFDVQEFLQGATITAASIGKVETRTGDFAGTFMLTNPDAVNVATFTVASNFTGVVVAQGPVKKFTVRGDFTGSLIAPSIGSITAFSFIGTTTGDPTGDPLRSDIMATSGFIGLLKSTAGVVVDYEVTTPLFFQGFDVSVGKLVHDTVGIDRVKITAGSIGDISVKLTAAKTAPGIDLTGIRDSQFVSTRTGLKKEAGGIGDIDVSLVGTAGGGDAFGIQNSSFGARVPAASTVNPLGSVTVKITGQDGASLGLDRVHFEGDTIDATHVTVSRGKASGATARDADTAEFAATKTIGALTFDGDATGAQVTALKILAGGNVGAVLVKARIAENGALVDSAILAGQTLDLSGSEKAIRAALHAAALGTVNVSGAILRTKLVAGANIAAITVGGAVTDSLVLAGAQLGGDYFFNGNDSFQRAASIAAVTIQGALTRTSIAAGIVPVNGVFGGDTDALAPAAGTLTLSSTIGRVSIGTGGVPAVSSIPHGFAIEAAGIKALKVGATSVQSFASSIYLGASGVAEDGSDIRVRVIA